MKKLAIMQPYLFPYIGYYQLVNAVDEFIFLDDVNFIKRGYVNRNSILMDAEPYRFTIPVENVSQYRPINEHNYVHGGHKKLLHQLRQAYSRAPYRDSVLELVEGAFGSGNHSVSSINSLSIISVFKYLNLKKHFQFTSTVSPNRSQHGEARLIEICIERNATNYINAAGGRDLYKAENFSAHGLHLGFIKPKLTSYKQGISNFVEGLSIIDALMWNSPADVIQLLEGTMIEYPQLRRSE